jgi:hypothetical protein
MYKIVTVNIKQGSFSRYRFLISGMALVVKEEYLIKIGFVKDGVSVQKIS